MPTSLSLPTEVEDLSALAEDLEHFTADRVAALLGPGAVAALDREDPVPARLVSRGDEPLEILTRLFLLGARVTRAQLRRALPRTHADVGRWGLVREEDDAVVAGVDLRPTTIGDRDVWLTSDLANGAVLPADHVLGLGGASVTLTDITVRTPAARALDLGTGSGIQTLGLIGHADHVIATDISARALQFARFNIALNAAAPEPDPLGTVEFREGSFLEPVDGDFDLIVSNPPFVISPRGSSLETYTYRDGGLVADSAVRHLIDQIPQYLRPGGVAQLLANWEVPTGEEWHERVGSWVRATGLDAWVIRRELLEPAHYVHTWLHDGGLTLDRDPAAYEQAYAEWLDDLETRDVHHVAFGYVILRRPATPRQPWVRLEEITGTIHPPLGETIARTLAAVDILASGEDMLSEHLVVADDVTEERYFRPGASDPNVILLRQGGGFGRTVQVDTLSAAAVGACDGELSLQQICAALATLVGGDVDDVAADVVPSVRGLFIDGLVLRSGDVRDTLNS